MSGSVKNDLESIESLDFEFSQPCDYKAGYVNPNTGEWRRGTYKCDNPAEWKITYVICCPVKEGKVAFYCDQHFKYKASLDQTVCPYCLTRKKPPMSAWKTMERI